MEPLYKFRPLRDECSLCRAKTILETQQFWFSNMLSQNDPMEGVYTDRENKFDTDEIFDQKMRTLICSFSAKRAFENPSMWGYYANGFKGIAIEVEVGEEPAVHVKCAKVEYDGLAQPQSSENVTKKVLTTKLPCWEMEYEYRCYIPHSYNENILAGQYAKVGKITKIYFGCPYINIENQDSLYKYSKTFTAYWARAKELKKTADANNITAEIAYISERKVETASFDKVKL